MFSVSDLVETTVTGVQKRSTSGETVECKLITSKAKATTRLWQIRGEGSKVTMTIITGYCWLTPVKSHILLSFLFMLKKGGEEGREENLFPSFNAFIKMIHLRGC